MEIKNRRIVKVGVSYYVNIPSEFIKNNQIDILKRYKIQIEEDRNETK